MLKSTTIQRFCVFNGISFSFPLAEKKEAAHGLSIQWKEGEVWSTDCRVSFSKLRDVSLPFQIICAQTRKKKRLAKKKQITTTIENKNQQKANKINKYFAFFSTAIVRYQNQNFTEQHLIVSTVYASAVRSRTKSVQYVIVYYYYCLAISAINFPYLYLFRCVFVRTYRIERREEKKVDKISKKKFATWQQQCWNIV